MTQCATSQKGKLEYGDPIRSDFDCFGNIGAERIEVFCRDGGNESTLAYKYRQFHD